MHVVKNQVDFCSIPKPSRFLQSTHQKRHALKQAAHQVNVLVFAEN